MQSYLEAALAFMESKEMRDYLREELPKFRLVAMKCADIVAFAPAPIVNAKLKMSIFGETECHFSAVSIAMYTALIHYFTCRLEARQALIYQLALGLTGENGKYNYSKAVHVYPPFFDITCSAKNYKIAPPLTVQYLDGFLFEIIDGFETKYGPSTIKIRE